MSNWIQLGSGNGYDFEANELFGPFDLHRDIVRPLTQSRYVRHTDRNWSVAIHSVAVARTVETVLRNELRLKNSVVTEAAAAALLHDVHEAVIGAIPTPVASFIGYEHVKALKQNIDAAVLTRLGLPLKLMPNGVHREYVNCADLAALEVERRLFLAPEPRSWNLPTLPHYWLNAMYGHVKDLLGDTEHPQTDGTFDFVAEGTFHDEYRRLVLPFKGKSVVA